MTQNNGIHKGFYKQIKTKANTDINDNRALLSIGNGNYA